MKKAVWTKIEKETRKGGSSTIPHIRFGKARGHVGINKAAQTILNCNRVEIYVDTVGKQIALKASLNKAAFTINKNSNAITSIGLANAVPLKNLPKKLTGKWCKNNEAIIFDYSRNAVKQPPVMS